MISPSTPTGTKIVCINVDSIRMAGRIIYAGDLVLGGEYTLERVEPAVIRGVTHTDVPVAIIEEMTDVINGCRQGHLCLRFRRRDLPESLVRFQTALLRSARALA